MGDSADLSSSTTLIDPAEPRSALVHGLELGETRRVERPCRKRGLLPL